ncbi:MAG: YnfA family protein [Candidatus Nitrosocosmicus sp.]
MALNLKSILHSLFFFFCAGLCEIGGGYLVWLWLREGYSLFLGGLGGLILFLYGIIPTFQNTYFHRVYAAYGGIFIVMSLLWGSIFEGIHPDIYDILGTLIAIFGIIIIFYYPRTNEKNMVGITSNTNSP